LKARLARPVALPDEASGFVPIGESVSDGVMFDCAYGYEPTELTMAQVVQADVSSIPAINEEEEVDESREPVGCVNVGDELSASMAPELSQPAPLSRQAQLVKGFEVFSMCGQVTPRLVPAGVVAFDLATPRSCFEHSTAPGLAANSA